MSRPHGYWLDSMRAVALGFQPRKPRPEWANKGLRRGASEGAWSAYEAKPLDWPDICRTARRGRLLAVQGGAAKAIAPEITEYDNMPEPSRNEQDRFLILLEESVYAMQEFLDPNKPCMARAYGDFHWAIDWLSRRLHGTH